MDELSRSGCCATVVSCDLFKRIARFLPGSLNMGRLSRVDETRYPAYSSAFGLKPDPHERPMRPGAQTRILRSCRAKDGRQFLECALLVDRDNSHLTAHQGLVLSPAPDLLPESQPVFRGVLH